MGATPQNLLAIGLVAVATACGPKDPSANSSANGDPNNANANINDDPNNLPDGGSNNEMDEGLPPRPAIRLPVATFNVGRLFDTVCDSNNCGDSEDFERQMSDAEFNFKVNQIATAIDAMDVDIITLSEVENQTCLDALAAELPNHTVAIMGETGRRASLDVAVLARGVTHIETRTHQDETPLIFADDRMDEFAREFLEVHLDKDGYRVVVFAAHFKAQRNDDPAWRLAEATTARAIAEATQNEFPNALVYVSGDLNDEPGTPPLDALTSNGGLIRTTREQAVEDVWTYQFLDRGIAIDHILYVPTQNGADDPAASSVVEDSSGALGGSDHAALRAEFLIWTD